MVASELEVEATHSLGFLDENVWRIDSLAVDKVEGDVPVITQRREVLIAAPCDGEVQVVDGLG